MPLNFFITAIKIINRNSLQVLFNDDWHQENILNLSELVFEKLDHHQIIERVLGADKEYVRFVWKQHAFIINFECYSQSCWLEHEGEAANGEAFLLLIEEILLSK